MRRVAGKNGVSFGVGRKGALWSFPAAQENGEPVKKIGEGSVRRASPNPREGHVCTQTRRLEPRDRVKGEQPVSAMPGASLLQTYAFVLTENAMRILLRSPRADPHHCRRFEPGAERPVTPSIMFPNGAEADAALAGAKVSIC